MIQALLKPWFLVCTLAIGGGVLAGCQPKSDVQPEAAKQPSQNKENAISAIQAKVVPS